MVKKGKWTLPGYDEKFGSTYMRWGVDADARRPCARLIGGTIFVDQRDHAIKLLFSSYGRGGCVCKGEGGAGGVQSVAACVCVVS